MKSAIITGATGFIGSWLVEELIAHNIDVTILICDDLHRLPANLLEKVRDIKYDPKEIFKVAQQIDHGYDVFYNLGWGGVAPEHKNNIKIQLENVSSSVDAVYFSKSIGCKLFIGAGTVAEYVYCDGLISGRQQPSPADIYGAAKVSAHHMCEVAAKNIEQDVIWTIISSTFGERRLDNNLITYTIRTLLNGDKPIYTGLEQMWDFLYIKDTVRALYLIGEKGITGKTYGIGSGIYRPLYEYINIIRDCIDPNLTLGVGEIPYKNDKVSSSCVDNKELVEDTGFLPSISFKEGIEKTIQYFKENNV